MTKVNIEVEKSEPKYKKLMDFPSSSIVISVIPTSLVPKGTIFLIVNRGCDAFVLNSKTTVTNSCWVGWDTKCVEVEELSVVVK